MPNQSLQPTGYAGGLIKESDPFLLAAVGLLFVLLTAGCVVVEREPPQTGATQGGAVAVEPSVTRSTDQSVVKTGSPAAKTPAKVPVEQIRKKESATPSLGKSDSVRPKPSAFSPRLRSRIRSMTCWINSGRITRGGPQSRSPSFGNRTICCSSRFSLSCRTATHRWLVRSWRRAKRSGVFLRIRLSLQLSNLTAGEAL